MQLKNAGLGSMKKIPQTNFGKENLRILLESRKVAFSMVQKFNNYIPSVLNLLPSISLEYSLFHVNTPNIWFTSILELVCGLAQNNCIFFLNTEVLLPIYFIKNKTKQNQKEHVSKITLRSSKALFCSNILNRRGSKGGL